jgi:hypothetical protein
MPRRPLQPVWIFLAIIFLIEAWLWDHLEPIVAAIVAAIPLRAFKQWFTERVGTLSPAMTLIVFIVPVILLIPLKMISLWLLMHEYWMGAVTTIVFAKLLGVGVTAFVFDVTRPKLLEIAWFERLYEWVLALRAKCNELVDPVKAKILGASRGDGHRSRVMRLILRFRKNIREAPRWAFPWCGPSWHPRRDPALPLSTQPRPCRFSWSVGYAARIWSRLVGGDNCELGHGLPDSRRAKRPECSGLRTQARSHADLEVETHVDQARVHATKAGLGISSIGEFRRLA